MNHYFTSIIFCALSAIAFSQSKSIYTNNAPKPIGPYSQAIKAGNTLYLSGQIALTTDNKLDTASFENEVKQVFTNIKAVLAEAKFDPKNVVKVSIFLTDIKKFKILNEEYTKVFSEPYPARETVEVKALPLNAHLEVSVIAVK